MATDPGMLGMFGLPSHSPEDEMRVRSQSLFQQGIQGINPTDTSLAATGARIGSGIGAGLNSRIPQEQLLRFKVVQDANKRLKDFQTQNIDQWEKMTLEERSQLYTKTLAETAFANGLPDVGAQAAQAYTAQKKGAEKRDAELEILGYERDASQFKPETAEVNLGTARGRLQFLNEQLKNGELVDVFPRNSNDPNAGRSAYVKDGKLFDPTTGQELPLSEFTRTRPVQLYQHRGGRSLSMPELINKMVPSNEQGRFRQTQRDVSDMMRASLTMQDAIAKATGGADGTVDITGWSGGLQAGAGNMIDNIKSAFRSGGLLVSDGVQGMKGVISLGNEASVKSFLNQNEDIDNQLESLWHALPADFRRNMRNQAVYKSTTIQLAYALARAQEPGARQLSEQDFRNAVLQVGSNLQDPEAIRMVLRSRIEQALATFRQNADQFYGLMYTPDGQPVDLSRQIVGPKAWEEFDKLEQDWRTVFETPWGTGSQPGPGLTNRGLIQRDYSESVDVTEAPDGVDPEVWQYMTPEEQALWQN